MRRPISSPFQSFRDSIFPPFAKKSLSDLFVQIPKVPLWFSPFLRNRYGRFPPLRIRVKPEPFAKDHLLQKLFQSQQWDAPFLPLFQSFRDSIFPPFAKTPLGFVRPNSEGPIVLSPFWETHMVDFLSRLRVNLEPRFARYLPCRFGLNLSHIPMRFLVFDEMFSSSPIMAPPIKEPILHTFIQRKDHTRASFHKAFSKMSHQGPRVSLSSVQIHLDVFSSHPG